MGEEALPFEALVAPFATESRNPGVRWVARDLKPPIFKQAAELFASGMSVRQVAARLQISRSEAGRLRLRAVAEGYLEEEEEREPEIVMDGHSRPN
jgi:hypothetical protein